MKIIYILCAISVLFFFKFIYADYGSESEGYGDWGVPIHALTSDSATYSDTADYARSGTSGSSARADSLKYGASYYPGNYFLTNVLDTFGFLRGDSIKLGSSTTITSTKVTGDTSNFTTYLNINTNRADSLLNRGAYVYGDNFFLSNGCDTSAKSGDTIMVHNALNTIYSHGKFSVASPGTVYGAQINLANSYDGNTYALGSFVDSVGNGAECGVYGRSLGKASNYGFIYGGWFRGSTAGLGGGAIGVYGKGETQGSSVSPTFGVYGYGYSESDPGKQIYGGYFTGVGVGVGNDTCYGVFGRAQGGAVNYAAYFPGYTKGDTANFSTYLNIPSSKMTGAEIMDTLNAANREVTNRFWRWADDSEEDTLVVGSTYLRIKKRNAATDTTIWLYSADTSAVSHTKPALVITMDTTLATPALTCVQGIRFGGTAFNDESDDYWYINTSNYYTADGQMHANKFHVSKAGGGGYAYFRPESIYIGGGTVITDTFIKVPNAIDTAKIRPTAVQADSGIFNFIFPVPSAAMTGTDIMDSLAAYALTTGRQGIRAGIFAGESCYIDSANYSVILGGEKDSIIGQSGGKPYWSAIIGGESNKIFNNADHSFIIGGNYNSVIRSSGSAHNSGILGGDSNYVANSNSSVILGGGFDTLAPTGGFSSNYSVIAGGLKNRILGGNDAGIFVGQNNTIQEGYNGFPNNGISTFSVILGGYNNYINQSTYSAIIAGKNNCIDLSVWQEYTPDAYAFVAGAACTVKTQYGIAMGNAASITGSRSVDIGCVAINGKVSNSMRTWAVNTTVDDKDSVFAFNKEFWARVGSDTSVMNGSYIYTKRVNTSSTGLAGKIVFAAASRVAYYISGIDSSDAVVLTLENRGEDDAGFAVINGYCKTDSIIATSWTMVELGTWSAKSITGVVQYTVIRRP